MANTKIQNCTIVGCIIGTICFVSLLSLCSYSFYVFTTSDSASFENDCNNIKQSSLLGIIFSTVPLLCYISSLISTIKCDLTSFGYISGINVYRTLSTILHTGNGIFLISVFMSQFLLPELELMSEYNHNHTSNDIADELCIKNIDEFHLLMELYAVISSLVVVSFFTELSMMIAFYVNKSITTKGNKKSTSTRSISPRSIEIPTRKAQYSVTVDTAPIHHTGNGISGINESKYTCEIITTHT